jgi:rod shape-determining protein MreC
VQVVRNSGQAFARVIARPMARLDRSRHVLLVFDTHSTTLDPVVESASSASSSSSSSAVSKP